MKISTLLPERLRHSQLGVASMIVVAMVLTSASIFATGPNSAPTVTPEKAWPVSIVRAEPGHIAPGFSAFGRVESQRIAQLRTDLMARIEHVLVREGEWVEVGQTLVRLDPRQAELAVAERRAELLQSQATLAATKARLRTAQSSTAHYASRYELANAKLQRHQDLMEKRLIAKSLLDEVVGQANQASIEYQNHQAVLSDLPNQVAAQEAQTAKHQALLNRALLNLAETEIKAPFSGPVLQVLAAPGNFSSPSQTLIEVADASGFEVRVQVPDAYLSHFQNALAAGQPITAQGDDTQLKLARLAGHVRSGQTGTDAFFSVSSQVKPVMLGKLLNLEFTLPEQAGLIALPVQALYGNNRIYKVVDDRLLGVSVTRVGERTDADGLYQVLVRGASLSSGDEIIATQLPRPVNGLLVDVARDQAET
ncbi:MAG: HlyD family efflux transporter periplasmic adaptor subunit [Pseudomonadota bacterium]